MNYDAHLLRRFTLGGCMAYHTCIAMVTTVLQYSSLFSVTLTLGEEDFSSRTPNSVRRQRLEV